MEKCSESSDTIGLLATVQSALTTDNHWQANNWIIDSGATSHICGNNAMFNKMEDLERPQTVTLEDGRSIKTSRQGTVKLQLKQLDGS